MDIMIWLAAGGAVAWLSFAVFKFNTHRGWIPVFIISTVGSLVGGQSFAPMISSATEPVIGFNPFALVVALATAIACLVISNMLSKRYGI